tara:strand:- start:6261 stop:7247 length:987 start_codon:yes stop_codon:yes gene_type:complete
MNVEIIAEIAQGYEGDKKLAYSLVEGAIKANADSIKLQLVYADELCIPSYEYYNLFKSLEMDDLIWENIVQMVHKSGKNIYFDIYGDRSFEFALHLKADGVKISSTDFYNLSLIEKSFKNFENVFISTSGVRVEDLDLLLNKFNLPKNLTLLHGFQSEPTQIKDNNLNRIKTLKSRYPELNIGFMDHSIGNNDNAFYLPLVALGLGVSCIEKHITLDYDLKLEDYISALSIERFQAFTNIIKSMEESFGISNLDVTNKEKEYFEKSGKVVVAKKDIDKGKLIHEEDLCLKRVTTKPKGTHFRKFSDLIGKKTKKIIYVNQSLNLNSIE